MKSNLLLLVSATSFCQHYATMGETQKPILPHRRSAECSRAGKKQIPISAKPTYRVFCASLAAALLLALSALPLPAATLYVWQDSPSPAAPHRDWATAAHAIQDAVDAALAGDTVLVTNGFYVTGGRIVFGQMTNRVAVVKPLTVLSVNGPAVTVIAGAAAPQGGNADGAIRCAYVGTNAVLSGFMLTNGHTRSAGDYYKEQSGGGTWCELSGVVANCTLSGNSAFCFGGGAYSGTLNKCTLSGNWVVWYDGGGAYSNTLNNCALTGNWASRGGGAFSSTLKNCNLYGNWATSGGGSYSGTLNNCTLSGNSASDYGGGAFSGKLNNSIVYYNSASLGPNYYQSALAYSCTTPLPAAGAGNIEAEPLLASATHLSAQSPCIGRGSSAFSSAADIDGETWLTPPCIGVDQFVAGKVAGPLTVTIPAASTNVGVGFAVSFQALIEGRLVGSAWDFGDGVMVSNRPYATHAWAAAGQYGVRLTGYNESYLAGVSATVLVQVAAQEIYYVNGSNPTPTYPYTNWAGAATEIQEAIDAGTQKGRLILVADGIYRSGGRALAGSPLMTNRVVLSEGVEVRSANGPAVTIIAGAASSGGGNGDGATRCAYVGNHALLSGFTLTNGHTRATGDYDNEISGGGAWCELSGVVTNCTISGNSAYGPGGGAYYGTLNNCTLSGNSAVWYGGGADFSTLNNCILNGNLAVWYGGGAYSGVLNNCTLSRNSASHAGGGSFDAVLNNCILSGNSAATYGGGASYGTLNNCTLSGNSASYDGGGVYSGTLKNCIVYYNNGSSGPNYFESTVAYSCTAPLPLGLGNITNEPRFVNRAAGDLRLQTNSPCINSGSQAYVQGTTDLDGHPRIVNGAVDMGACEFQGPGSSISYAWLQQYGLPTDGSADAADPDHDGQNNWREWVANTNPTNALSFFRLETITNRPPIAVRFSSSLNRLYTLKSCTNLAAPVWLDVPGQANVPGTGGLQALVDTDGLPPRFYRVGVALP